MEKVDVESEELKINVPFSRVMTPTDRQLPYKSRKSEHNKALFWEQRKLLLSEIEFLTNFGDLSKTVLYVGAADGQHIGLLAELFIKHKFILYDSEEFHQDVKDVDNIETHNEDFTDDETEFYVGENILFISDLRSTSEQSIKNDMDLQMKWHLMLKPKASLLKFQLSYIPGITSYLKGDIYYQMWAPPTSTECRLLVQGDETSDYDNTEYESKMYRFNKYTRFQTFDLPIEVPNMIHGYDLLGELYVLSEYLNKVVGKEMENIPGYLQGMMVMFTRFFGKSLEDKYSEAEKRYLSRIPRKEKQTVKTQPKTPAKTFRTNMVKISGAPKRKNV